MYERQMLISRPLSFSAHSTYYDRRLRQGPALIRARRPYLFRNSLTGLGLVLFITGIYTYTLKAVGQDEFADVKVPDAPRSSTEKK
ncbi:hypothetical protein CP532_5726 [Ophiocordyceps camponoti-leonardi (nom. inval.)]|nr:hypothetical protein CP532_5726 [Ophiocordyceps camponoti-leonardi (nom. inval.)]